MDRRFEIEVERRSRGRLSIVVEASDLKQAALRAVEEAGAHLEDGAWREEQDDIVPIVGRPTEAEPGVVGSDASDPLDALLSPDGELQGLIDDFELDGAGLPLVVDTDGTVVLSDASRSRFVRIAWSVDAWIVSSTQDAMVLVDPEGEMEHLGNHPAFAAAFHEACDALGIEAQRRAAPGA